MFTQVRSRTNPYKLYIGIDAVSSFVTAVAFMTAIVYRVRSGHLNPLQLVLLGTMVEICYLVMQLPSGVLALAGARYRSWRAGACSPPWRWCSPGSCLRQGSGPRPGLRASAASHEMRGAG